MHATLTFLIRECAFITIESYWNVSILQFFLWFPHTVCLKEMIDEADRDGDGEVNQEEFLRIMKKTCLYWRKKEPLVVLLVMLLIQYIYFCPKILIIVLCHTFSFKTSFCWKSFSIWAQCLIRCQFIYCSFTWKSLVFAKNTKRKPSFRNAAYFYQYTDKNIQVYSQCLYQRSDKHFTFQCFY